MVILFCNAIDYLVHQPTTDIFPYTHYVFPRDFEIFVFAGINQTAYHEKVTNRSMFPSKGKSPFSSLFRIHQTVHTSFLYFRFHFILSVVNVQEFHEMLTLPLVIIDLLYCQVSVNTAFSRKPPTLKKAPPKATKGLESTKDAC